MPKVPPGTPRLLGHVGEGAVAIVLVERVANRLRGLVEIARAAVHQVDVHPAVVVVIEEGAAGAHGLGQVVLGRCGVVVNPANAAGFRRDLLEERARIGRRGRPQQGQAGGSGGEELAAVDCAAECCASSQFG